MHNELDGFASGSLLEVVGFEFYGALQFMTRKGRLGNSTLTNGVEGQSGMGCGWVTPALIDPPLLPPPRCLLIRLGNWGKTGSRRGFTIHGLFETTCLRVTAVMTSLWSRFCESCFRQPLPPQEPLKCSTLRAGGCWTLS